MDEPAAKPPFQFSLRMLLVVVWTAAALVGAFIKVWGWINYAEEYP